jgi:phosphoribosylformylglycinamidine cyclo-ligase
VNGHGSGRAALTYAAAGVDVEAGEKAVALMRNAVESTHNSSVLGGIGGFAGLLALDSSRFRDPVLASASDGVGTKLLVARALDRHDTVGIDLVAMVVDDVVATGAEPLFVLDYLAVGRLVPERAAAIVEGVAEGCRRARCALLGGETAEHPDAMEPDAYDLAGFAVGVVDRDRVLGSHLVRPGDALLALGSSGLHSNGYSLARRVLERAGIGYDQVLPELGRPAGEELLEPTRIYAPHLVDLLAVGVELHALCHVTGGGLPGNLPRSLPSGLVGRVDWSSWTVPPIFRLIGELGPVEDDELARATNLGIGMVAVLPAEEVERASAFLTARGIPNWVMGEVSAAG